MEHLQSLTGFNFFFYLANLLWVLEFVIFRSKSRRGHYQDRTSFYGLVLTIILTIVATIFFNREGWGNLSLTPVYPWFQVIAFAFYSVGLFLRYYASHLLGQQFTRHVHVDASMQLVSKGPYRYLRHPLYLGLFLLTIAFPLYAGNWLAFLVMTPLVFLGLLKRMLREEKALETHVTAYKEWKKHRYRFLPFVF